jgi:hypothetical protein
MIEIDMRGIIRRVRVSSSLAQETQNHAEQNAA